MDGRSLGRRIVEARGRAGLTQAELAVVSGVDRSVLAEIETGQRLASTVELSKLAIAMDSHVSWLMEDPPPAIVSYRNAQEPGTPSPLIDKVIERIARSVELVAELD